MNITNFIYIPVSIMVNDYDNDISRYTLHADIRKEKRSRYVKKGIILILTRNRGIRCMSAMVR